VRRAAIALLTAAALGGCGAKARDERSFDKLERATHECRHYGGVVTITDVGNGSYGKTSGFFVLCHDDHVIRVDD
jgi:hypothetical protein